MYRSKSRSLKPSQGTRHTKSPQGAIDLDLDLKREVDALGVIIISRGCFERFCSNKNPPHIILTLVS